MIFPGDRRPTAAVEYLRASTRSSELPTGYALDTEKMGEETW
jgi:hypothetical protein